jgi:asparagine synthase (glutamine-hydrolysing)
VLPLVNPDRRANLTGYRPGEAIAEALNPSAILGRHPLDIAQYVWIKTMLEGQILTWGGDRVDMANSMEARPAFLDHHLAEFCATIPPHMRIKAGREKHVLREAMKGVLPQELYNREKFAFMAPPAHTDPKKQAAVTSLAERYLDPQRIEAAGLLDPGGVRRILDLQRRSELPRGDLVQLDALVNHILGVQVLHESLIERDIPRIAADLAAPLLQ